MLQAKLEARVGVLEIRLELDTHAGTLVLVGPNGAGKTSVLLMLLGARKPDAGYIRVADELLFDSGTGVDVPLEARRLGYVPQSYGVLPHLSARANIEFALGCMSPRLGRHELQDRTQQTLAELQLLSLAEQRASTLSGGEQQRVALARVLASRPRALLLDEPLGALDAGTRRSTRAFLASYLAKLAVPCVIVTHDPADARALGSRIAVIEAGRIVQQGSWADLVAGPKTAFVTELVSVAEPSPV